MDYDKVTLETINGGVAGELFDEELRRVIENIHDPNTKPDTKREIVLKFTITPDKHRQNATTEVQATSKLVPYDPHKSFLVFGSDGTTIEAYTTDPRQQDLPYEDDSRIVRMGGNENE